MARPYRNRKRRGKRPSVYDRWQIERHPGKFEGEGLVVQYLYSDALDGEVYGYPDGSSDTVVLAPLVPRYDFWEPDAQLNRSEKRFLKTRCGAVLHESSNGFVSATWFPNTEAGKAQLNRFEKEIDHDHET